MREQYLIFKKKNKNPEKQDCSTTGDLASADHGKKSSNSHVEAAESHPQEAEPTVHPSSSSKGAGGETNMAQPTHNPSSSSKGHGGTTNMDQDIEKLDLTQVFAEGGSQIVLASNPRSDAKTRFLACDLVVPGIAIKKMAMCVSSSMKRQSHWLPSWAQTNASSTELRNLL